MNQELICIGCPMGCRLSVVLEQGNVLQVMGNSCPKGKEYAKNECLNPSRVVTTTITVEKAMYSLISVKTSKPIPKNQVRQCVAFLRDIKVEAPVKVGQVIVANILGTQADIVATKSLDRVS
ncbi:MAG: DUF1667 domain-containing protein [Bacillota bacterium]